MQNKNDIVNNNDIIIIIIIINNDDGYYDNDNDGGDDDKCSDNIEKHYFTVRRVFTTKFSPQWPVLMLINNKL